MNLTRLSLRTIMVIFMSLMSMILVVVAWEVYRGSALKSQQQSLEEVLVRESNRILRVIEQKTEDLAIGAQQAPEFRQALIDEDLTSLERLVGEQYQRNHVASGELSLIQLYVFNKDFDVVSWSKQGPSGRSEFGIICQTLLNQARQRQGTDQIKLLPGLCQWRGRSYFSLIVPVGGILHQGYLQVITDPLQSMVSIEKFLEMPIKITLANGDLIYRSQDWLTGKEGSDFVTANYWLTEPGGGQLAEITVQRDLNLFNENITTSRNLLMLSAGIITLLMVALVLWALHRSTIRPIRELIDQVNMVRRDRRHLGKTLKVSGNVELRELVQVFNDMSSELAQAYDEYEELAFTDQLTELPNRALFHDRLKHLILLSKRKGEKFGVMLLDLDSFKEVNDTLGHHVGDELLKHIANRLQHIIRASSTIARVGDENENGIDEDYIASLDTGETTIARLGGDEFAILLPNLGGVEGAVAVAKRVTEALEPPAEIDANLIVVAGTLGISMYPEHGENAESLLRRADVALYVAKHIQNDFSVYDPAYDRHSVKQLALKAEIRTAIDEDQLVLYYQPKLDLNEGCVASVEALVRWQHPQRGMIPPDQFIPLSEQRGLIGPLTEWVIRRALEQHNEWLKHGINLKVAVNLSSRLLYDLYLPSKIEKYLINAELPPSALGLEITEEATMVDPERAMLILKRLDEMGVTLSIDDFGTGHSSLAYLKRLPVDEIKIDRSFVMEMEESENDAKIVHATIDLSHNLGLKVVAEGVESATALSMLKTLNCDYAQGFHLSRPIPADELLEWLTESGYSCKAG